MRTFEGYWWPPGFILVCQCAVTRKIGVLGTGHSELLKYRQVLRKTENQGIPENI
jgi:hypothetical protein